MNLAQVSKEELPPMRTRDGKILGLSIVRGIEQPLDTNFISASPHSRDDLLALTEWVEYTLEDDRVAWRFLGKSLLQNNDVLAAYPGLGHDVIDQLMKGQMIQRIGKLLLGKLKNRHRCDKYRTAALRYYSPTAMSLRGNLQNADQWRRQIAKLPGLAKDEKTWNEMYRWLDQQANDKRLNTTDLISHCTYREVTPVLRELVASKVKSTSTMQHEDKPIPASIEKKLGLRHGVARLEYSHPALGYKILRLNQPTLFDQQGTWLVVDEQWQALDTSSRRTDNSLGLAQRRLEKALASRFPSSPTLVPHTQWDAHSLPGGEDRREWVLTLPEFPAHFYNEHFRIRNVLFHLRTSTRFTRQGKHLLVIEELQSDWLQKRGNNSHIYEAGTGPAIMPWASTWYETAINTAMSIAVSQNLDGIAITDANHHIDIIGNQLEEGGEHIYDRILPKYLQGLAKTWGCETNKQSIAVKPANFMLTKKGNDYCIGNSKGDVIPLAQNKLEAMRIVEQHSKRRASNINTLLFNDNICDHIKQLGIPLFGKLRPVISAARSKSRSS
ncbi:MAG: hypothetical protein V7744_11710 [Pseudomonadales bacterium]